MLDIFIIIAVGRGPADAHYPPIVLLPMLRAAVPDAPCRVIDYISGGLARLLATIDAGRADDVTTTTRSFVRAG
eukprot:scaffold436497_cov19-Prasinocladus_malaysianus.AAC.1